uniref:G-protein coupled receptors family 1 profile domain-containing protein n=2 Tax=Romanomermis culicivorax TaxID=13658 RepID=A0A915JH64_ROMCU
MWTKVLLGLFLATCVVLAAFGNLLVILTVFLYKKMRSFTNLLIVSLASADLMVSTLVMPFALTDLLLGHRLLGGPFFGPPCMCIFFKSLKLEIFDFSRSARLLPKMIKVNDFHLEAMKRSLLNENFY